MKTTHPKSQERVRLALIGASRIASKILPSIRSVSEVEVLGVASARAGKAQEFALQNKIKLNYNSYQACLSDPMIDAVYISTLNRDHAALIEKSLQAGKHVLCEKPLVPTAEEAKTLYRLAKEKKLILLEGFMYRFHPQIKKLKEFIASGAIGEIKSIRVNFSFLLYDFTEKERRMRARSETLGGALFDIGCYGVDFVNSILSGSNAEIARIQVSRRSDPSDPDFDLATSVLIDFTSGVTAFIECAVDTPGLNNWEVSGSRGSVSALRFDPQGSSGVPLYFVDEESEATLIQCETVDTFAEEFRNFSSAIMGSETPHILPDESMKNAAMLNSISTIKSSNSATK